MAGGLDVSKHHGRTRPRQEPILIISFAMSFAISFQVSFLRTKVCVTWHIAHGTWKTPHYWRVLAARTCVAGSYTIWCLKVKRALLYSSQYPSGTQNFDFFKASKICAEHIMVATDKDPSNPKCRIEFRTKDDEKTHVYSSWISKHEIPHPV